MPLLKNSDNFDLEFKYSNVEIPDFEKEDGYVNVKMKEKDADSLGEGLIWKAKYFADHNLNYEPQLIESFNKRGNEKTS